MNDLIIFFIADLVIGVFFLCKFKRKRITQKDFDKTSHNEVII